MTTQNILISDRINGLIAEFKTAVWFAFLTMTLMIASIIAVWVIDNFNFLTGMSPDTKFFVIAKSIVAIIDVIAMRQLLKKPFQHQF